MYKYRLAVVIGRFQPFHVIHKQLVDKALELGEKTLVVLGSSKRAPSPKNPFPAQVREEMIRACYSEEQNARLIFRPLRDFSNELAWETAVQNLVRYEQEDLLDAATADEEFNPVLHNVALGRIKTALVGHYKDNSSYYLRAFPQWQFEELPLNGHSLSLDAALDDIDFNKVSKALNSTDIRRLYFGVDKNAKTEYAWHKLVPVGVAEYLKKLRGSTLFEHIKKEFEHTDQYKADTQFVNAPHAPTFVTTDAVVVCRGHVLLVRRGHQPGIGLLACPGGFLARGLRLKENAIKELKEETRIALHPDILRKSVKDYQFFDEPDRSQRGRTITHAFYLELFTKSEDGLPLVKGGDDAAKAFWLPLSSLPDFEEEFFEDHYDIVRYFIDSPQSRGE